jgi:hypothetical protein
VELPDVLSSFSRSQKPLWSQIQRICYGCGQPGFPDVVNKNGSWKVPSAYSITLNDFSKIVQEKDRYGYKFYAFDRELV